MSYKPSYRKEPEEHHEDDDHNFFRLDFGLEISLLVLRERLVLSESGHDHVGDGHVEDTRVGCHHRFYLDLKYEIEY